MLSRVIGSLLWALVLGGLDAGYIGMHGVDLVAIVTGAFAALPAWAFIARDVEFSFLGQKFRINTSEAASAAAEVIKSAPKAIEQAQKLPPIVGELRKELEPARLNATARVDDWQAPIAIDPNAALAYLGKEIEARVSTIADLVGAPQYSSPFQMVKAVQAKGIFPSEFADGLERLMRIGYAAAGGATIVSDRPLPPTHEVLAALDTIIDQLSKTR
jgi:hypothetical protein